ncbi:diguanylate cyclase/phosphodiesterase (GGDEF & EAL domains) with PAS/PAC sensor(s) [hydrothermal vent metagenome]|uniref:Diguanylate cyclase/phosphodiesterase (GGDEF & EAL domains) with PAS/PAC sensor(S) n=1 Tax=hydrothermal vent metagenome TaxID=652676 RepID=A0A3B0XHK4_9ZZZZ
MSQFNNNRILIIDEIITKTDVNINQIELELTESSIMDDVESAIENMRILTNMGLNISIDDFGTGSSSFSYLKQFTINKLKIDRKFIKDTPDNHEDVAIVEAIMEMAYKLNLKEATCDVIQGCFLGKPMPADEATRRMQDNDWENQHLL